MIKIKPIFEGRIGAYIGPNKVWNNIYFKGIKGSWPMSKIFMYRNHLILKVLYKEFKIIYSDIDYIEHNTLFGIRIHHHNPDADKYVYFGGIGTGGILYKKLKDVIKKNKLKIKTK